MCVELFFVRFRSGLQLANNRKCTSTFFVNLTYFKPVGQQASDLVKLKKGCAFGCTPTVNSFSIFKDNLTKKRTAKAKSLGYLRL